MTCQFMSGKINHTYRCYIVVYDVAPVGLRATFTNYMHAE